jgi:hypothetical protein
MSVSQPYFTIAIPVRNGADYLREALDSALAQTFSDYEIVISDNASEDATPQIISEYQRAHGNIRVLRSDTGLSLSSNWNNTFSNARGEWVKILAHDDLLHANCLERIAEELERVSREWRARCGLIGTAEEWLFEGGKRWAGGKRWLGSYRTPDGHGIRCNNPIFFTEYLKGTTPIPLPAAVTATLHKSVLPERGPFDERYFTSDTISYLQIIRRFHYLYIPEILCVNRIQAMAATRISLAGKRYVTEAVTSSREALAAIGNTVPLRARLRMRWRPASVVASQVSRALLRREPDLARGALGACPATLLPLVPLLTLRALRRDLRKIRDIGLPAKLVL